MSWKDFSFVFGFVFQVLNLPSQGLVVVTHTCLWSSTQETKAGGSRICGPPRPHKTKSAKLHHLAEASGTDLRSTHDVTKASKLSDSHTPNYCLVYVYCLIAGTGRMMERRGLSWLHRCTLVP